MRTIKVEKKHFPILGGIYDWNKLTDSKEQAMFSRDCIMNQQKIASLFNLFEEIEILENDTVWGNFKNEQKLLISYARDIFAVANETQAFSSRSYVVENK